MADRAGLAVPAGGSGRAGSPDLIIISCRRQRFRKGATHRLVSRRRSSSFLRFLMIVRFVSFRLSAGFRWCSAVSGGSFTSSCRLRSRFQRESPRIQPGRPGPSPVLVLVLARPVAALHGRNATQRNATQRMAAGRYGDCAVLHGRCTNLAFALAPVVAPAPVSYGTPPEYLDNPGSSLETLVNRGGRALRTPR